MPQPVSMFRRSFRFDMHIDYQVFTETLVEIILDVRRNRMSGTHRDLRVNMDVDVDNQPVAVLAASQVMHPLYAVDILDDCMYLIQVVVGQRYLEKFVD